MVILTLKLLGKLQKEANFTICQNGVNYISIHNSITKFCAQLFTVSLNWSKSILEEGSKNSFYASWNNIFES